MNNNNDNNSCSCYVVQYTASCCQKHLISDVYVYRKSILLVFESDHTSDTSLARQCGFWSAQLQYGPAIAVPSQSGNTRANGRIGFRC